MSKCDDTIEGWKLIKNAKTVPGRLRVRSAEGRYSASGATPQSPRGCIMRALPFHLTCASSYLAKGGSRSQHWPQSCRTPVLCSLSSPLASSLLRPFLGPPGFVLSFITTPTFFHSLHNTAFFLPHVFSILQIKGVTPPVAFSVPKQHRAAASAGLFSPLLSEIQLEPFYSYSLQPPSPLGSFPT